MGPDSVWSQDSFFKKVLSAENSGQQSHVKWYGGLLALLILMVGHDLFEVEKGMEGLSNRPAG